MQLLVILLIPALAAGLSMLPAAKPKFAAGVTIAGALAVFMLSLHTALAAGKGFTISVMAGWVSSNAFSALILVLVSFVGLMAAIFSWGYILRETAENGAKNIRRYYGRYNLFLLSMLAVPLMSQLAMVWIAVELTTLLSVFLVAFEDTPEALEAAWKYVVLTCMGAALALIGILILYWGIHLAGETVFTWSALTAAAPDIPPVFLKTAFLFILIGFGTKAGLVPLHTWLPDAHSQAPSPVCALLSGVETTTALYAILRLLPVLGASSDGTAARWLVVFGLISAGAAAFLLVQARDYKRLFAFSTIEHMGIILVAVGLGGQAAHLAATYQIMAHAVTKSFCFFAAGAVLMITGTRDITSVRGLIRTSPTTGAALLIGALAIAGAPPFAVFLSELSIFKAGLTAGQYLIVGLLTLFVVVAFCGIMFPINRMVFGKASAPQGCAALPFSNKFVLYAAVVPVITLGIFVPDRLYNLLRLAATIFGGG